MLVDGCQIQSKWGIIFLLFIEFFPDDKVAFFVEDLKVGESIEENIELTELLCPVLCESNEMKRTLRLRFYHN